MIEIPPIFTGGSSSSLFFNRYFNHSRPHASMNITAGLSFYLHITINGILNLFSKNCSFRSLRPGKIPPGDFLIAYPNPQPLCIMEKVIGTMSDGYPNYYFRTFRSTIGYFDGS